MRIILTLLIGLAFTSLHAKHASAISEADAKKLYQMDADVNRLEHLLYWTKLIEEYKEATGHYPFQNDIEGEQPGLVRIATKEQRDYFMQKSNKYRPDLDNNGNKRFKEFSVKGLRINIEQGLGRKIEERYDPQRVPVKAPVWYNYFVTKDGYLLWTVCNTCGVTKISTLLMDGSTPTVNIVSEGMKGKVTKALTREEMINHPIFKNWQKRGYLKEDYFRQLEQQNARNSEQ